MTLLFAAVVLVVFVVFLLGAAAGWMVACGRHRECPRCLRDRSGR